MHNKSSKLQYSKYVVQTEASYEWNILECYECLRQYQYPLRINECRNYT